MFPYLYVPYDDDLPRDATGATHFLRRFAEALDSALDFATAASSAAGGGTDGGAGGGGFSGGGIGYDHQANQNTPKKNPSNLPANGAGLPFSGVGPVGGGGNNNSGGYQNTLKKRRRVVHACSLVRAKSMYGFHACDSLFIKISIYDPSRMSRVRAALLSGGIHGRTFQPHEAHVPFILQTMMDFNLHGAGVVKCSEVTFRDPVPRWPKVHTHRMPVRRQWVRRLELGGADPAVDDGGACREAKTRSPPVELEYEDVDQGTGVGQMDLGLFDTNGYCDGSGGGRATSTTPSDTNKPRLERHRVWTSNAVPLAWTVVKIPGTDREAAPSKRSANCELEIDVLCENITNSEDLRVGTIGETDPTNSAVRLVPSLKSVWDDEKRRADLENKNVVPPPVTVTRDAFSETSVASDPTRLKLMKLVELAADAETIRGVQKLDLPGIQSQSTQSNGVFASGDDGDVENDTNAPDASLASLDVFATAVPANRVSLAAGSGSQGLLSGQPSQPSQPSQPPGPQTRRVSQRLAQEPSLLLRELHNALAERNQNQSDDFEKLAVDRDMVVLSQAAVAASPYGTQDYELEDLLRCFTNGVDENGEKIPDAAQQASISAAALGVEACETVQRNLSKNFDEDDELGETALNGDALDSSEVDAFATATQREWSDLQDVLGTAGDEREEKEDVAEDEETPESPKPETRPSPVISEQPGTISCEVPETPVPPPTVGKMCYLCHQDCSKHPRQWSGVTGYAHKSCAAIEAEKELVRQKRRASIAFVGQESPKPGDFQLDATRLKATRTEHPETTRDTSGAELDSFGNRKICIECGKPFLLSDSDPDSSTPRRKFLVSKGYVHYACANTPVVSGVPRRNSRGTTRFGLEAGVATAELETEMVDTEDLHLEMDGVLGTVPDVDPAPVDDTVSFARYALTLRRPPPSYEKLVSTFAKHDLPQVIHPPVFYGNPADVPKRPPVVGGLPMRVPTTTPQFLRPFSGRCGNLLDAAFPVLGNDTELLVSDPNHNTRRSRVRYALRLLRLPPSRGSVERWARRRLGFVGGTNDVEMDNGTPPLSDHVPGSIHTPRAVLPAIDAETAPPPSPYHPPTRVTQWLDDQYGQWLDSLDGLLDPTGGGGVSSGRGQSGPAQIGLGDTSEQDLLGEPVSPVKRPQSPKYEEPVGYLDGLRYHGDEVHNDNRVAFENPPNAEGTPNARIGATPTPNVAPDSTRSGSSARPPFRRTRWSKQRRSGASQITAPTDAHHSTPASSDVGFVAEKGEDDKSSGGAGAPVPPMGVLCVEVIGDTRGDLLPDPKYDRVLCVGFCFSHDNGASRRTIALALRRDDQTNCDPPQKEYVSPETTSQTPTTPVFVEVDPEPWIFGDELGVPGDVETHVFSDENALLRGFVNTVNAFDPDVLVGFEIQGESLGYLVDRGKVLGVDLVRLVSRDTNIAGANERQDDEYGRLHASGIYVTGRIVLNLWRILRGELKLQSYTFESCVLSVLRTRVAKFVPKTCSRWARGDEDQQSLHATATPDAIPSTHQKWRAINHVTNRSLLVLKMCEQLDIVARTNEQAKIFGIDFQSVVFRGSQYRVESMMLRLAHRENFLAPSPSQEQTARQPAMECLPLVMEPESKMYTNPVAVLDFASLYPSVVCAYNLCYSTCLGKVPDQSELDDLGVDRENQGNAVQCIATNAQGVPIPPINAQGTSSPDQVAGLGGGPPRKLGCFDLGLPPGLLPALVGSAGERNGEKTRERTDNPNTKPPPGVTVTPNGVMFTPKSVRPGILPRLLTEILDTRVMVKSVLKRCDSDSQKPRRRALNAKQFGLKLIANVTYGYTAAGFSGRMPMAELADAIVQCGRDTLERAIRTVHNDDPRWQNAKVVYGDTDSLFVEFPGYTKARAFEAAAAIAKAVTADNPDPVTLKLEKVYHPCILVTKKRYVGHSYETVTQVKPIFDAKGIEVVRRDSCPVLVKMQKTALQLLFHTKDLSLLKRYVQRNVAKLRSNKLPLQDLVFAKETRLGTYSNSAGATKPPAAIVAEQAMKRDPRTEPKHGERVPYIVVAGEPGSRVIDIVKAPQLVVESGGELRVETKYYCDKIIEPALQRIFGLVGADVGAWLKEPNVLSIGSGGDFWKRVMVGNNPGGNGGNPTMERFFASRHCAMCGDLTTSKRIVCETCSADAPTTAATLTYRATSLEIKNQKLHKICLGCGGGGGGGTSSDVLWTGCASNRNLISDNGHRRNSNHHIPPIECVSLDCSVYYSRRKTESELRTAVAHVELAFTKEGGLG